MIDPKSPAVVRLTKTWYKKLAKDGEFVELEDWEEVNYRTDKNPNFLDHSEKACDYGAEYYQDKADYYMAASQFLWSDGAFRSKLERDLWFCHTEGMTLEETVSDRNVRRCRPIKKSTISEKLIAIRKRMIEARIKEIEEEENER